MSNEWTFEFDEVMIFVIGVLLLVLVVVVLIIANDQAATQHCIDTGRTAEECGWR